MNPANGDPALALHTQTVPPLCNLHEPDPDAPFLFAAPRAAAAPLARVLVAGLARGGAGAAMILARANGEQAGAR